MSAELSVYVTTPDLDRMRKFYEQALDVKAGPQEGNWIPFDLGGATFALHGFGPEAEEPVRFNLSFVVDDIDAVVGRFEAQGAKVLRGIADETFGRMAVLEDPDGRTFSVVQH